jgi:ubiquinone/menaquinone biosynthesis C-methylase UbiE
MNTFTRSDGRKLPVVTGFRERVLGYRPAVTPRADWTDAQYAESAERKRRRAQRMIRKLERWAGSLAGQRVLDVGCGDGANCLVIAGQGVRQMTGIDLELKLSSPGEVGERTRRLAAAILNLPGAAELPSALARLPLQFRQMDATQLDFEAGTVDVLFTRSAMEHIRPVERALTEMIRVVRPGGLLHLVIDPFYWVRGCHKRGVVDMPWAHARLTQEDYRRFVRDMEGQVIAARRSERLETLNCFTVAEWRRIIEAQSGELLAWEETPSVIGAEILAEHPDVLATLQPGIEKRDLLCERIEVWLRKK